MFDKLLLPTDGSDLSIAAAHNAVALAKLAGARLNAVYVVEPYPYTGIGAARSAGFDEYMAAAREHAAQAFARIGEVAAAQGVQVESQIVEDAEPAHGILEAARLLDADVIVMGSHGRSGAARLLLGSVTAKVLAQATLPVLVVK